MKDPHVVSFSPMWHFTDHNIRVHVFTCVLALQIAHLMRRKADHSGLHLSVREILTQLAGVQETVSIYPSTGDRPKAALRTQLDSVVRRLLVVRIWLWLCVASRGGWIGRRRSGSGVAGW
jgi:hypothetical protein